MIIIELISDICTIGGGQTLTKNLSISLSKQRRDVKVIVISLYKKHTSPIVDELENYKIPVIYLNKKRGIDLKCAQRLNKIIGEIKPDIIHAHLSTQLTIYLSGISDDYRIFYTFHSVLLKASSFSEKINNLITKRMLKKRRLVPIAISPIVAKTISEYFKIKCSTIIFNGVDTSIFCPKTSFYERQYDFAVIGSFSYVKNQKQIISILHSIHKKGYFFKAVFLGDGPLREECMDYVQKNHLDSLITFKGNVNDTFNYLKDSCFLVMKSLFEGNPMVINEAIACGTFVISNNVGGIPDILDSSTGSIVDKDNDAAFEESLIDSLQKKIEILKAVNDNLEQNRNRVSIDRLSLNYLKLFEGESNG